MLRLLPLLALLLGGCAALAPVPPASGLGATAPDLPLADARTGEAVALWQYEGRVVLLNVWATWCAPCRHEMPALDALQRERPDDVAVLFVATEPGELVRAWMADQPGEGRHLLAVDAALRGPYAAAGRMRPVTFVVDRAGVLRERVLGAASADTFRRIVAGL
jgi:thiol-disulfide isomerase/thioredoxin